MLIALEQDGNVPFAIQRVYYIFATKNDVHRGRHAHRHLNQFAVAVRGSVTFLLDDGGGAVEVVLNDTTQGLLLGCLVWREDRTRVVQGKSGSVRLEVGGRRVDKKNKKD